MGASSQMMMPVCFESPSWSEFFFKLHDDVTWREMGILKQECAVHPPSKRRAAMPEEATQRATLVFEHTAAAMVLQR